MLAAITKRTFSTVKYRTGISNDLVVSASMGWSAKQPQSHAEHYTTLKSKQAAFITVV